MKSFFWRLLFSFKYFSGTFERIRAKFLRTPKNLPAPTTTQRSLVVDAGYLVKHQTFSGTVIQKPSVPTPKFCCWSSWPDRLEFYAKSFPSWQLQARMGSTLL